MKRERKRDLRVAENENLDKAFKVNAEKLNRFMSRNRLLDMPPTEAVKKVWESSLTDNEVAYLIYTIGIAAGASCDHDHGEEDFEEYAGVDPGEGMCKKCGVYRSHCVCGKDNYIG